MLFLNNGNDRGFTTTTLPTAGDPLAGSGPVAVAIGDLSGHGPHDIVVADGNSNTVTLFLMATIGVPAVRGDHLTVGQQYRLGHESRSQLSSWASRVPR